MKKEKDMKKKWKLVILSLLILSIIMIIFVPKNQKNWMKIIYYYGARKDKFFEIPIKEKKLQEQIRDELSNQNLPKLPEETELTGKYHVEIDENTWFEIAYADDNRVKLYQNGEIVITEIKQEIIEKIVRIVDKKLEKDTEIFRTNTITLTGNIQKSIQQQNIISKIRYFTKEFTWNEIQEDIPKNYDLKIDFHNETILYLYEDSTKNYQIEGYMSIKNQKYKIYNVDILNGVLKEIENDWN